MRQISHLARLVPVRRSYLLVRIPVNTAALSLGWMTDGLSLITMCTMVELVDDIFLCAIVVCRIIVVA